MSSSSAIPLADISSSLASAAWKEAPPETVNSVQIDSRQCGSGDLFVALQGEETHGHEFVESAVENGAVAAVVESVQPADCPQLVAESSLSTLQALAGNYRETLSDYVVGITGSCGKTTVKDLLAEVLESQFTVGRTPGNYNNHIGLPLTVLNEGGQEVLVAEVAMNKTGEIRKLSEILGPHLGIITHIGPAHLAGVNTVEQLAREKAQLLACLSADGLAVVPQWLDYENILLEAANAPVAAPSLEPGADIEVSLNCNAKKSTFSVNQQEYECNFRRRELVKNAVIATVAAKHLGVEDEQIQKGLARSEPLEGRGKELKIGETTVIDGSYNANPDSMDAALERLKELPPPRLAVLGTMKEMGDRAPEAHRELGKSLSCIPDLQVHYVGEFGRELAAGTEGDIDVQLHDSAADLNGLNPARYSSVLVKASNAVGLRELVSRWSEEQ